MKLNLTECGSQGVVFLLLLPSLLLTNGDIHIENLCTNSLAYYRCDISEYDTLPSFFPPPSLCNEVINEYIFLPSIFQLTVRLQRLHDRPQRTTKYSSKVVERMNEQLNELKNFASERKKNQVESFNIA